MDSIKIKNFARKSRREINKILGGSFREAEGLEFLGSQIYLKLIMMKFLEARAYIGRIFIGREQLAGELAGAMEGLDYIWQRVFPESGVELREDWLKGLLASDFMAELLTGEIVGEEWKDLEIIGWLYQYYISELNEEIIGKKQRYEREEIGLATQLFTPGWIVKYLVENSLGRYYIEANGSYDLIDSLDYYLDGQRPEEARQPVSVADIKCLDPALGAGNILIYLFDFLYRLYELEGFRREDIAYLIFKNNLYGLEIDCKVYAVAVFVLLVKAREHCPNFLENLKEGGDFRLNISCIEEVSREELEELAPILGEGDLLDFFGQFINSKVYGSLTRLGDFDESIYPRLEARLKDTSYEAKLGKLIKQHRIMGASYDIVISNPPYIGIRSLNTELRNYLNRYYSLGKYDSYSAFILYCMERARPEGHIGLMTPYTWMFIKSYEELRKYIIDHKTISSLVQLEYSSFSFATVPICIFSLRNYKSRLKGEYVKLSNFKGREEQSIRLRAAVEDGSLAYRFSSSMEDYRKIPHWPISYWVDERIYEIYEEARLLEELAPIRQGIATGNNAKYLRLWHEVDYDEIGFGLENTENFHKSKKTYAPYNKGGRYRKWYGNFDYVIDFREESYDNLAYEGNKLPSRDFYFQEAISWSFVSSSYFGVRYSPRGSVFDVGGSSLFPGRDLIYYITGLMCSKLADGFMNILNPTLNYQVGDIKKLPIIVDRSQLARVNSLVQEAIEISRQDWDSFEESWDFRTHPVLEDRGASFRQDFQAWMARVNENFQALREIEEEINRIFIAIYGLEGIMSDQVRNRDITIRRIVAEVRQKSQENIYLISQKEALESFLSFIVGLVLGRYSLDAGLITSPAKFRAYDYPAYRPKRSIDLGRIYSELRKLMIILYGQAAFKEDLAYMGKILGLRKDETPRQRLIRYFTEEFMDYHIRAYKRRPIYSLEGGSLKYRLV